MIIYPKVTELIVTQSTWSDWVNMMELHYAESTHYLLHGLLRKLDQLQKIQQMHSF